MTARDEFFKLVVLFLVLTFLAWLWDQDKAQKTKLAAMEQQIKNLISERNEP